MVPHLLRGFELWVDGQHLWAYLGHGIVYPDSSGKMSAAHSASRSLRKSAQCQAERAFLPPLPRMNMVKGERKTVEKKVCPIFKTSANFIQQGDVSSSRCVGLMACSTTLNSALFSLLLNLVSNCRRNVHMPGRSHGQPLLVSNEPQHDSSLALRGHTCQAFFLTSQLCAVGLSCLWAQLEEVFIWRDAWFW